MKIYPFPHSSGSNKYIELLYSHIPSEQVDNFSTLFFKETGIIHIHWTNVIYGSKFALKTLWLMVFNFSVLYLLKLKGYKIVWTMHNYYPHDNKFLQLERLGRAITFRIADAIVIHQKSYQLELERNTKNKKIVFIPHGNYVNVYGPPSTKREQVRKAYGFGPDHIILASIGAIKPYKKIENIIAGFDKADSDPRLKLFIAGQCDENYAAKLESLVISNDRIKLVSGFIHDDKMPEHLAMADYLLFWYDGSVLTSGGIILALSYGVPVIARDISAAELIKDGKNGFKFKDELEFVKIIEKIGSTPGFNSKEVIDTVKDLDWDKISKEFMNLYNSLWKN